MSQLRYRGDRMRKVRDVGLWSICVESVVFGVTRCRMRFSTPNLSLYFHSYFVLLSAGLY